MFEYEYDSDDRVKSYKERKAERRASREQYYDVNNPERTTLANSRKEAAGKLNLPWWNVKRKQ